MLYLVGCVVFFHPFSYLEMLIIEILFFSFVLCISMFPVVCAVIEVVSI